MLVQKIMPRKLRGFTLTEAAIVLGIVGLILGAIWVAAASVYCNLHVSRANEQVLTIVQSVRSMHATQQSIGGADGDDLTLNMIKGGAFPKDMIVGTGAGRTASNPWNGLVTMTQDTSLNGTLGDAFALTYAGLPEAACIDLAVRLTGPARDGGLIGAAVAADNSLSQPLTVSTAATNICTATGSTNVLTLTFKIKS